METLQQQRARIVRMNEVHDCFLTALSVTHSVEFKDFRYFINDVPITETEVAKLANELENWTASEASERFDRWCAEENEVC